MRALLLVVALLAAGCVGAPVDPAVELDALPVASDPAVVVHRAGAAVADASILAQTVASALRPLGVATFEPTLGVDADGVIFYSAISDGVAIGSAPVVMRSQDGGITWEDVSATVAGYHLPPETNDPYLYVDVDTGRVFHFSMAPILVCAVLSWSDDKGESWTTNPRGCGNTPPWDHQSITAVRPNAAMPTVGYANVLVQCVNNNAVSSCARSLDGGLAWTPGAPIFATQGCGGLHGHPVGHPDSLVFLPKMNCGSPDFAVSADGGLTWTEGTISATKGHPWPDPAMAVDKAGNVYYAWVAEKGEMLLSVSVDAGATWSEPVVASPPGVTTHLPAVAANDAGHVVLAYPGTPDLPDGYASGQEQAEAARWHGYLTLATDALASDPTFVTARVTPADDPVVRGPCGPERCPGMVDFIDVVIGPDGRPYAAFVDACSAECHGAEAYEAGINDQSAALLATLTSGPLL